MSVSVKIPTQLREATGGEALATVDGATVGEVLDSLYERYGELRNRIAEDGGLRRFVNVYVGEEDIRFLDYLDTAVSDGDVVTILPAVAGGATTLDTTGIRDYLGSLMRQEAHRITTNPSDEPPDQAQARANDLRSFADRLQGLPEDDERLARLARCWFPEGLDGPHRASANANQVIRGYATEHDVDGLGHLLDRIAELDERER
jgi:molybdopterin synthase sulfur carrier subunit